MDDTVGAFVPGQRFRIEGRGRGALAGLTFAAKDLFDVAGRPTGAGNPDWAAAHPIPRRHAAVVEQLLEAGATLIGKTVTDEVSLGILGESAFFGTPRNPRAPNRVPGGSSSGSAAAVAAGLCDLALGTDTGGSVRVPASFCGLYGLRPTHGRLDLRGMVAQAPSSDTAGWLTRDAQTMSRVSQAMFGEPAPCGRPRRLKIAVDAFGFADRATAEALAPLLEALGRLCGSSEEVLLAPQGLSVWGRAQRTLQPAEAYATFSRWLDARNPRLAFNVARGLMAGAACRESDLVWARLMREEARARLDYLLRPGAILALPTTPFPAPSKGLPLSVQNPVRERLLCLCAHGGLAGFPQLSVPGASADGCPVGLSLMAARGADLDLITVALALEAVLDAGPRDHH